VLGRRSATTRYTYGYGRAEDLAGVFIVLLIAASGGLAGWQSVQRLLDPQPIANLGWVMAAALVGFRRQRVGRDLSHPGWPRDRIRGLIADGFHAGADGFTSLAVLFGPVGVLLGFPAADPLVGLDITVAILFVLKDAALGMWRRLMDPPIRAWSTA
jgi:cation diffusion facilitator family transporter